MLLQYDVYLMYFWCIHVINFSYTGENFIICVVFILSRHVIYCRKLLENCIIMYYIYEFYIFYIIAIWCIPDVFLMYSWYKFLLYWWKFHNICCIHIITTRNSLRISVVLSDVFSRQSKRGWWKPVSQWYRWWRRQHYGRNACRRWHPRGNRKFDHRIWETYECQTCSNIYTYISFQASGSKSSKRKRGSKKKMEGRTTITLLHPDGEPKSPKGVKTTVVNQCGCYVRENIPH